MSADPTRVVRLGLGHTCDVSMIEGQVEVLEIDALPQEAYRPKHTEPAEADRHRKGGSS